MTDWPLPGSTEVPAARFPPAVELVAVERVVAGELVSHLVGDVVDGEEVAGRSRETRASGGLGRAADDAELGDAAAGLSEPTVAEVVVARADDLADDDAVTPEIRAPEGLGHA